MLKDNNMNEVKKNILDNKLYKKYYPITSLEDSKDFIYSNISYIRKILRNFELNSFYMEKQLTDKYTKKIKDPLTAKSIDSAIKIEQTNQQILLNMKLDSHLQRNLSEIDRERNMLIELQQKIFYNDFSIEDSNMFLKLINDYRHYKIHHFLCLAISFIFIVIIFLFFVK